MSDKTLVGKKAISEFVGRSWGTIRRWIREEGFPAKKIDGCLAQRCGSGAGVAEGADCAVRLL